MSVLWATEVVVVPEGNHRVERVGEEVFPVVDTMSAVSGKCTGGGALYQVSHPLGRLGGGGVGDTMSAVSGKCTGGGALYQVSHPLGGLGGGRGGGHNVSGVREVYWRRCSVPGESPTGEIRGGEWGGVGDSMSAVSGKCTGGGALYQASHPLGRLGGGGGGGGHNVSGVREVYWTGGGALYQVSHPLGRLGGGGVEDTMSAVSGKCTGGGALYQVSHPLGRLGGGGVEDTMSAVSGKCTGGGALYQVSHPLGGLGGGGRGTQCQRCQGSVLEEVLCTR